MQNAADPIPVVYAPPRAPSIFEADDTTARHRLRPGIVATWRETFTALSAQSAPVLACAFAGFALASILSSLLGALFTLDMYARTGTVLASYGPSHDVPLMVQAIIGLIAGTFARGAITWLALHPGYARGARATLRAAARATLSRAPALLLTAVFGGIVIFLGNLGMTELLRELKLDLTEMSQLNIGFDGMARSMALRILSDLLPQPLPPFNELLSYFRVETSRVATTLVYAGGLSYYRVKAFQELPLPWLVGGASVLALIAGDTLLRFTNASIMASPKGQAATQLLDALRLARRRFWVVLTHIWLVRIALLAVSAVFMIVPNLLVQNILVPLLIRGTGNAWFYLFATALLSISFALVSMLFVAFAVIYDARLFLALQERDASPTLTLH